MNKNKHGFTLIELLVAVGLLAMMMLFAGMIFNISIDTYRTSMANTEIMQKLQVITGQLNADFKGVIWSYPGRVSIETVGDANADCIAFLANGNFQSTLQYGGKTVTGNIASIFYGQAADAYLDIDPNMDPFMGDPKEKVLVRRQTIFTSDKSLPDSNLYDEYYKTSLSEWEANPPDVNEWIKRPSLNLHSKKDLMMYMAKGVDNFTIEWCTGIDEGRINWQRSMGGGIATNALKFTFTLYDSKGIIKNGKIFTYIVYLE